MRTEEERVVLGMWGEPAYQAARLATDPANTFSQTEQTLFAENAVQYRATLAFLEGRINTVRRALKGE